MTTVNTTATLLRFNTIEAALRALLAEVTPGIRPHSNDSYLPDHLIEAAQAALDGIDVKVKQRAHNALSMADWHVARGEPDKAQPEALTMATTNAGFPSAVQK